MEKILVLDGRSRATITIIRSLGRAGKIVYVGEEYKPYSAYSKFCKGFLKYPSPADEPEAFKNFIKEIINNKKFDAIIPVRDHTTSNLIEMNKDCEYNKYMCLPSSESYKCAVNKAETIKIARKLEIPHPRTLIFSYDSYEDENNLEDFIKDVNFPLILKPAFSSGSRGIVYINNHSELYHKLAKFKEDFKTGLIQEFIPYGGSFGVEFLFKNGEVKARFTHKRIREYPASGGPSTCRISVKYPIIEEYSEKILKFLNWNGVAMVEFRIDSRNNIPMLMEINPRFWGSLSTAYYAGVNFPLLLADLIIKKDCETIFDYKEGIITRWILWGELLWFFSKNKNQKLTKDFFNFFNKDIHDDIIDFDDPKPIIGILVETFTNIFNFRKLKHVFNRGW
ncbi:MAG: ATP-grasp domain-containing protein [Nitrososphaerota archaeon]